MAWWRHPCRLLIYHSTPSIYLSIWLYIRPILLFGTFIVDTRLHQSSCGSFINWLLSIESMSASSASCDSFFSNFDKTPLQTYARLLQLKRPPRGLVCTSTPSYFDHWVLVIAIWRRSTCDVFGNGNYMMRRFLKWKWHDETVIQIRAHSSILLYSMLNYYARHCPSQLRHCRDVQLRNSA